MANIDATGDCWEWIGSHDARGYGLLWLDGRHQKAHRLVYAALVGDIPEQSLDHLCRNRTCVNPDHLEPVSLVVNTLRGYGMAMRNARSRTCRQGHPFDTLRDHGTGRLARSCLTCTRAAKRAYKARQRVAA